MTSPQISERNIMNMKMTNAEGDPVVTRVNHPDHYATETSMVPRVQLPYVPEPAVRNLAVVATTTSAATIDRQRALAQLKTMAATGDADAITMMEALKDLVIEHDTPFDPSIPRVRTGYGNGVWRHK
jgi:hypothetical protein